MFKYVLLLTFAVSVATAAMSSATVTCNGVTTVGEFGASCNDGHVRANASVGPFFVDVDEGPLAADPPRIGFASASFSDDFVFTAFGGTREGFYFPCISAAADAGAFVEMSFGAISFGVTDVPVGAENCTSNQPVSGFAPQPLTSGVPQIIHFSAEGSASGSQTIESSGFAFISPGILFFDASGNLLPDATYSLVSVDLPLAEIVGLYIAGCAAQLKIGSIQRRLNAIAEAHKAVGVESPTHQAMVTNTMKGIRRTKGTAPGQKAPALTEDIRAMVDATDSGIIGARDRALVLLGFAGAFRRSELVRLDIEDCIFGKDGLTILLRRSKTDQDGAGRKIGIPYRSNPETCPVRVLQSWLEQAGITSGPLFRSISRHGRVQPGRLSGVDVARIVKKLAKRGGLDPAKYAGHSLRAGHATSAAIAGASERSIMNQTGHRSVQMVRRYIRDGSLFRENSAGKLGL